MMKTADSVFSILALALTSCAALGQLPNFSEPQFLVRMNEDNTTCQMEITPNNQQKVPVYMFSIEPFFSRRSYDDTLPGEIFLTIPRLSKEASGVLT